MMRRTRSCLALLDGVAVGPDPITRLSPFALARLADRAARQQRTSVRFWREVSARAVVLAPSMQPLDMSTLLSAFARLRFRDKAMMSKIAEATPAILGQFRASDITHFLGSFARLDMQHRLIFNLFAREISRKLHDFDAAQLGELVYAYARLELRHALLLSVLKKRVVEVVKALKPWHLAMVANGFARLGESDERFFTVLAAEICRKISDFPGKPLALVANAYARLSVRNRFLLELLSDEAFRRRGELEPQAVALLLNAHARLQLASPVIYDYFAQDVARRIRSHTFQSLCMVASAFARQRRAEPTLFEKIGDHAATQASKLYPRAVATLLFSFSEVEIRHGVLFYHAPEHVAKHVAAYSTDELLMIARAYGRFQMVHLPLFDAITGVLPSRKLVGRGVPREPLGEFEEEPEPLGIEERPPLISSLVGGFEAYARLNIYEATVAQLLCDAIEQREEELVLPLVVQATRSAAAFSFAHPGLLRIASGYLEQPGDEASQEDLGALSLALQQLGVGAKGPVDRLLLESPSPDPASQLGGEGRSGIAR